MNAIARRSAAAPAPALRLTNFGELVQFAQMAAKSALVPPEYRDKPESIMLAVQLGSELGLAPMQSIQNIAVIGGRPAVFGDAMLALVQAHPDCLDVVESEENGTAVCTVKRRGRTPVVRSFSVEGAKLAKLWGKAGPWQQYPTRMLQMRARGFALRDAFPDVLKGLITSEEARDIPTHNGPTLDAMAEPVRAAAASVTPAPVIRADWSDDDAIPALDDLPGDDETSAAVEVTPSSSLREAINKEVVIPMRKPTAKPTVAEWLSGLQERLKACQSREEVEGALLTDTVCKAHRTLQGAAKERLREITAEALARWPEPTPAGVGILDDDIPF